MREVTFKKNNNAIAKIFSFADKSPDVFHENAADPMRSTTGLLVGCSR
jgi:hypothetical protein